MKKFFSIIIPAKNESRYIKKTLEALIQLNYPKEFYEVIVVENCSKDNTYEIAKSYKKKRIKVFHLDKGGVSLAKNFGASKVSTKSEWLIFLDADTILKKNFLITLNNYLSKNENKLVVGTSNILPIEREKKWLIFMEFYNSYLKVVRASLSIQIIRKKHFQNVKYDESLKVGEDYKIISELTKFGDYFFLETDQVKTSMRRFENVGYTRVLSAWALAAILPKNFVSKFDYQNIR